MQQTSRAGGAENPKRGGADVASRVQRQTCWGKGERPDRIAKTIAIRKETSDPYCADVIARIEIEDAIHELGNRHPDTARSLIAKAEEIVERALSGRADNESLGELKSRIAAIRQQYRW